MGSLGIETTTQLKEYQVGQWHGLAVDLLPAIVENLDLQGLGFRARARSTRTTGLCNFPAASSTSITMETTTAAATAITATSSGIAVCSVLMVSPALCELQEILGPCASASALHFSQDTRMLGRDAFQSVLHYATERSLSMRRRHLSRAPWVHSEQTLSRCGPLELRFRWLALGRSHCKGYGQCCKQQVWALLSTCP